MDLEHETQIETLAAGLLSVQPSDALVVKTQRQLDPAQADKLAKQIRALLGVGQVLVVGPLAKIAVLRVGTGE